MKVNICLLLSLNFVLLSIIDARNVPNQPRRTRTYGNFHPNIKHSYGTLDSSRGILKNFDKDVVAAAVEFFASEAKVETNDISVSSFHTSKHNGVTHVYLLQNVNGVPIANGFGNMNILRSGAVHSIGNAFYNGPKPKRGIPKPKYSASNALEALAKLLNIQTEFNFSEFPTNSNKDLQQTTVKGATFAVTDVIAELNYLQTEKGLKIVWKFTVEMPDNYYFTCVDAETNEVISLIDGVSDATYNVLPLGMRDPRSGSLQLLVDPENLQSSPVGWLNPETSDTMGNNVIAQANLDGDMSHNNDHRPTGKPDSGQLLFNFPLDQTQHPEKSMDASVTQLFYMNNIVHDIFYQYGFDEEAGNFQEFNHGLGGAGSDAVIANAQDGSGYNNANFMTLPDGRNGRMRMYLFQESLYTEVPRDAVFDSTIVVHEYMHGISTRLTGGRDEVTCLGSGESGGMGEGWGDIFGVVFQMNSTATRDLDFEVGTYVTADHTGIRNFPYSTSLEVNPLTYALLRLLNYEDVHSIGEIWAAILFEVYWNLVEKHGFQDDWYQTNPNSGRLGGNVVFAQLLIDGMKLQPCDPTFVDARNAILFADEINNNGDNAYELWKGFAKRGLGVGAISPGFPSFRVPVVVVPTTPSPGAATCNFANVLVLILIPCVLFNFY